MTEGFSIRPAVPADAPGICAAHIASIREVCSRDYTPDEIESWVMNKRPEVYPPRMEKFDFWVAVARHEAAQAAGAPARVPGDPSDEVIAGYIDMHAAPGDAEAEIYGLYLAPWAIGHGAGRMLVEKMFEIARARAIPRVFLFGTKTARPFYERMGFRMTCAHAHTTSGGLTLECWRMEREL